MINIFKTAARKIKTGLLLLTICFGLIFSASAQDSKGTDFWVMFNTNYTGGASLTLFITSAVNTSGTVSSPAFASIPFTVTANTVTSVAIPSTLAVHGSDVIDSKGIHVTSLQEVTVYGLNQITFTTDAYLAYPTDALGTNYRIVTYQNTNVVNATEFGVVGTVNATTVTITPSVTTGAHTAGVPYNIVLNQGQTYELVNGVNGGDFTGTLISSTQPVGVFGAHGCANIPSGCTACDHICEMLPPTTTWGTQFVTVPLGGSRTGGDQWKFMASDNATTVSINGVAQAPVLNAGQFMERNLTAASVITANHPILVTQFARGITCSGGITGDPFMMIIPPYEQFLANYTITTVSGFTTHFVNLVVPNSITGTLTQDGVAIPAASFTPIGATGFSGAVVAITAGSHTYNGALPFGVFAYGWNSADSYGYTGGQSFSPIALVSSIDITPESGTAAACTQQCWSTLVKDQFNNPVAGVRVDFTVTGANPQLSFANTNANGIASYCYTGINVGQDIIKASIGTLSDQSVFNWTASTLSITAGSNSPVNVGGTLNLTASAGFASYSWKDPNGVVFSTDQNPSIPNATAANAGTYTVTGTAVGGCTATGTVNVVVSSFSCPADIIENIGTSCTKSVVTANPVFNGTLVSLSWVLSGATTGASPLTGINYVGTRVFKAGTTVVTYTAKDGTGTTYTCSYIVKLTENVPPEIRCPLDKTVYADPGVCTRTVVALGTPVVSDNCAVMSVTNNAPAVYQPGSNFVTWTVTDYSGNTRTCVQEIYVADNQRPTITCPANIIVSTGPVCEATLVTTPNPVFSDNCGVVRLTWAMTGVSWGSSPNTGINYVGSRDFATGVSRITYAATDAAGNTQTCTFTVTVKDNTPPTITCPPTQTLCKLPSNSYTIPLMVQSDNCDIARTDFVITGATNRSGSGTNASGIFNVGAATIKWTVKDVAGNTSTCTTVVNILPLNDPLCTTLSGNGGNDFNQGGSNLAESPSVNNKLKTEVSVPGLSIVAWPNPAQQYFNLKISSPANEMVQIRMIDMSGKVMQSTKGLPGENYVLGDHAQPGIYTIEVSQAGKTVRAKVVKQ